MVTIGSATFERRSCGRVRMNSVITGDKDEPYIIWYEVDEKYSHFLCQERSDAFLVALLPHLLAKSTKEDSLVVRLEQPLSEKLYYQLTQYYIPTLAKFTDMYNMILLDCTLDDAMLESAGAIGTGVSGGVDSFYTLLTHNGKKCSHNRRITHGVYCNTGMFGGYDGQGECCLLEAAERISTQMGLAFVEITSNICKDVYTILYGAIISQMFMSFSLALQKLFSVYYFSSETSFDKFSLYQHNSERYDLFNVHCLSTQNLQFYSAGGEVGRIDKVNYLSDFKIVRDQLLVCAGNSTNKYRKFLNCSRCSKCTYTMVQLDVLNKLDMFSKVFDVKAFRKDPGYYYGYFFYVGKKDAFKKETFDELKKRGTRVRFEWKFRGAVKIIKNRFRRLNPLAEGYKP